ncbi:Vacuolar protein sorting-associated protein 33B-like protein, partial [Leptotrombidium deliense]
NSDLSSLNYVSYIITQIKCLVGNIQRVHTLGKYAKMALKLSDYLSEGFVAEEDGFITDMVLIDRDVDYTSLLLSQLTYEGLLDEVYGIKCGTLLL